MYFISCEKCLMYEEHSSAEEASAEAKKHCVEKHKGNPVLTPTLGKYSTAAKAIEYRSWHPDFWEKVHPKCVECGKHSHLRVQERHYCKAHNPL